MNLLTATDVDIFKTIAEYVGEVGRIILLHVCKGVKLKLCSLFNKFNFIDNICDNLAEWAIWMNCDATAEFVERLHNPELIEFVISKNKHNIYELFANALQCDNEILSKFLIDHYNFDMYTLIMYVRENDIAKLSNNTRKILRTSHLNLPHTWPMVMDFMDGKIVNITGKFGAFYPISAVRKVAETFTNDKLRVQWAKK